MSAVELSCGLPPGPDFTNLAVQAEELGYRRVWIFDSSPLWEDPFVHLALAAERTETIGLATAVLIPTQRSVVTMASSIATIARISGGRFRSCFGTGFTSQFTIGQRPMSLDALAGYVTVLRRLLEGGTATVDGQSVRMLHAPGLALDRPIDVPLWVSVFGPRGRALAGEIADGVIGRPHPTLPAATIFSGTVLDPDEDAGSRRVREAIGPWRVVDWHTAYAAAGPAAVDDLPGGRTWREAIDDVSPVGEDHLFTFEGHVTHLSDRDRHLLPHIDIKTMVGPPDRVSRQLGRLGDQGFAELIYTPTGPDVRRELAAFASALDHVPIGGPI